MLRLAGLGMQADDGAMYPFDFWDERCGEPRNSTVIWVSEFDKEAECNMFGCALASTNRYGTQILSWMACQKSARIRRTNNEWGADQQNQGLRWQPDDR